MAQQTPILFFRIGYMKAYDGVGQITGGGSYPEEHGEGGEMWNFRPESGRCYGYVMTRHFSGIDLYRLDDSKEWKSDDDLGGVDIVFIARKPAVGQVIVGWYKNATVFHKRYHKRRGNKKQGDWEKLKYLCEVDSNNAVPLSESDRTFKIPSARVYGEGYPGQSNVWYADSGNKKIAELVTQIRKYIGRGQVPKASVARRKTKASKGWSATPDKTLISRIEQAAIDKTWAHYKKQGYSLTLVAKDNRGWDLEASKKGETLYLEVKGHLGNVIQFELTPNEYTKMQEHSSVYRVCIVRSALELPDLAIFTPHAKKGVWCLVSDASKEEVQLSERVAARASEVR